MSYIGNSPSSIAFLTDTFNGTGSQTAYTLSAAPASTSSILVAVSGVLQDPSTYGVTGLTLTFSAAPPSGTGNISVRYLGIPASGVTTTAYRTVTEFTATAGQTTFSPPSYTVGFINVYRNGVRLGAADYTATNGTTVVLATGATSGDLVTVESFQVSSVLNAIPNTPGAVTATNIDTGAVTAAKLASGAALSNIGTGGVTASYLASGAALSNLGTAQLADANMAPGSVIQVVQTATSSGFTSNGSDVTVLSQSITPSSSSSRILISANCTYIDNRAGGRDMHIKFKRNSTVLSIDSSPNYTFYLYQANGQTQVPFGGMYLDSPATASSITYSIVLFGSTTVTMSGCHLILMEIAG